MSKLGSQPANCLIIVNKKAKFNYFIEKTMEAGIVLEGWELKSIRAGKIQIQDFATSQKNDENVCYFFIWSGFMVLGWIQKVQKCVYRISVYLLACKSYRSRQIVKLLNI